ncbi:MAG: hypothetical protein IJ514_01435 [Clostridia bacterium]|nr:hypothetical protein [Clostridia bacterium]
MKEEIISTEEVEPCFIEALKLTVEYGRVSIAMLQRKCRLGYNKAGRIVEWMEREGYVSALGDGGMRKVLLTKEQFLRSFGEVEPTFIEALRLVVHNGCASIFLLQRRGGMSLNGAKEALAWMEENGYVSAFGEDKTRTVLITAEEFTKMFGA